MTPTVYLRRTIPDLTPRQAEVLALVALGADNAQIAQQLGIAKHTAALHVSAIYQSTGIPSRPALVTEAVRRGWIAYPEVSA